MTLEEEIKKVREEMGDKAPATPSCLGPCDECDYRKEKWEELLGHPVGEEIYYL